jgi:membrane protein DedA with SNARE-associated domain
MADFLVEYGVVLVFAWVFAAQAGMPIPAGPMLVGAGALSGSGQMNLALVVGAAIVAAVGADVSWYSLGRSQGTRLLETLCRFSMNPDSVVRDTKERFLAHSVRYVVLAKFLPGVNPFAAGLAGAAPIRLEQFLLYASTGALLWAGAWISLGYLFADTIGRVSGGVVAWRQAGFVVEPVVRDAGRSRRSARESAVAQPRAHRND